MTTTAIALQTLDAFRLAFTIVIEGVPLAFTTTNDAYGMSLAYAGTPWASYGIWRIGAFLPGETKQAIESYDPSIKPDTLSIRVADGDDSLARYCLANNDQAAAKTFLTVDMNATVTTATVLNTTAFAASGELFIGSETLGYSGKTGTTFTGLTRGKYALFQTNSGADFSRPHRTNTINGLRPIVSSRPRQMYNRGVAIYLHHMDENGTWSTRANAVLWWTGRIKSIEDNGDRTLTFAMMGLLEQLQGNLLEDQFTGDVLEGLHLPSQYLRFRMLESIQGTAINNDVFQTLTTSGAIANYVSWQRAESSIAADMRLGGMTYKWAITDGLGGTPVRITVTSTGTPPGASDAQRSHVEMALYHEVWNLLGFDPVSGTKIQNTSGSGTVYELLSKRLNFSNFNDAGDAVWEMIAENLPIKFYVPPNSGQLQIGGARGTWVHQPYFSTADHLQFGDVEGFLQLGDIELFAGLYDAGTGIFTIGGNATSLFQKFGFGGTVPESAIVREGEVGKLTVKQVWYERGNCADVMRRLFLSTGTSGFNHATWDKNPASMSLGLPYSVMDFNALAGFGHDDYILLITQPVGVLKIVESALAILGKNLVFKNGKFTLVEPRIDGPTIAVAYVLDESNKARPDDRPTVLYSPDGVINRVELQCDRGLDGSFRESIIAEDLVSITDFGQKRVIAIEGWGVGHDGWHVWVDRVAARALATQSRPLALVERTLNWKLYGLIAPGDTALLTDNYVMDPKLGVRGCTELPCYIKALSWDPKTFSGKVSLAFSAEISTDKICNWSPSARVDEGASNAGYVVVSGSVRYLACKAHQYSSASEDVDVAGWNPGDALRVRELSPAVPASPVTKHVIVDSVDEANSRIYLTAAIAGWNNALRYIVEPDVIGTVVQAQKATVFVASATTHSTGAAADDSYLWGGTPPLPVDALPAGSFAQPFVKPPPVVTTGEPLSVADIAEAWLSANTLHANKTRQVLLNDWWPGGATTSTADWTMLYGPMPLPCFAGGTRKLIVRVRIQSDGTHTANFRVWATQYMPDSQSAINVTFGATGLSSWVTVTTTSATPVWSDEFLISIYPLPGTPPSLWISVEAQISTNACVLSGITIAEDTEMFAQVAA